MLLNMKNARGQVCGIYNTDTKTYHSKRYVARGQLFLRKNKFEGQLKERAIAIDRNIISSLLKDGCEWVVFTIIGLEEKAYSVKIKLQDILTKGVKINYDKTNKDGVEYTGFGEQYVVSSVTDCIKLDINQLELDTTKPLRRLK